ncbi:PolyA polymerase reg subunit [Brazilian cedratvirus IHUMI]|uniref:PolyA polymerase reg subunit n=1 Tax=Brazilian cedratvirus IHUMI TaxID=2126980 RepID=A0A2R8FDD7_9VIRU|nr:PolyA polymerase reg subunit [Brazilian cedratvirus IHUMI]
MRKSRIERSGEEKKAELLSEMEFLSRFWKGGNAYLVYLSSDLSSLPLLAKLFPSIKFHAYSSKEESSSNLIYHKEEFNDELAKGWKNTRALYPVYLVSYHALLEEQRLWYSFMEPNSAFLCLNESVQMYLSGFLFVQPGSKRQVMLVPEEGEDRAYKNLDRRINFYQNVTRKKIFASGLSFDQAYEEQVLYDYSNKTKGDVASVKRQISMY